MPGAQLYVTCAPRPLLPFPPVHTCDPWQPSFGGNMMFSNFWGPSPFDFFFYRPYRPYYVYGRPLRAELGFLESVFSYIFGDGDPNNNIEEVRVRAAAAMIKANGFAVTAEQLAPFSSPPDSLDLTDSQAILSESFVLPIVTALGGIPAATADGDIVYVREASRMYASSTCSP